MRRRRLDGQDMLRLGAGLLITAVVGALLMGNAGEASGIGDLTGGAAAHAIAGCVGIAGLYAERLPMDKHGEAGEYPPAYPSRDGVRL